jgi:hypothetical protein
VTINMKSIGKWLAVIGAIASAVIGAVGTGTLPTGVRAVLIAVGAGIVAWERRLSTTVTVTVKAGGETKTPPPS